MRILLHAMGFGPGARVELLDRETVVGEATVGDNEKVVWQVPFDEVPGRLLRRKARVARTVWVSHVRAVSTGVAVDVAPRLWATSGNVVTVDLSSVGEISR